MIWPFKKKLTSDADAVFAIMDDAIQFASEKWKYFTGIFAFKESVSFKERFWSFFVPASEGLRNNFPALKTAPDPVLMLIVAKGIQRSGTHIKKR